jgi:Tol biopolymer transport system component
MPRIADALERESRTVDLEQGDFERLLGRRERTQRNRRIRAGGVGVAVALVMGIILARSLPSDRIPADPPVEPRPAPAASGTLTYILDGDVFVADPDGSNAVKIADGISLDDCASATGFSMWGEGAMWSPDGRYLAYRRTPCPYTEEDWGDVVIADAAGNVLATFPADGWDIGWSPDSTRVAVWDTLFETVGVYGVDGARQAQIAMPSGWQPAGDHDPAWLRDGTLAVDAVELPLDGGPAGSLDQARAAEGRQDYLITIGQRAVSPDGSRAAFVDGRSLVFGRSDGTGSVTLLTAERGTFLAVIGFSPEGDRILFSKDGDRQGGGRTRELWSVGVDGSDARLVVAGTENGEWFVPSEEPGDIPAEPSVEPQPAAYPSGTLAYVLDGDVYVADPDGANAVRIADGRPEEDCAGSGEYWAEGSMWSPDGLYLAFRYSDCSDPDHAGRDVVISDAEGNVLASFPAQGWNIAWSPDSTRVAVWNVWPETIGVYGLDGTRQAELAMPPDWTNSGDDDPVWTTDGTSLNVGDLEVPLEGGTPSQAALPDRTYSPDGSQVAYVDDGALVVAAADGSGLQELVEDWPWANGTTSWSPTGDHFAFTAGGHGSTGSLHELRVLDAASGSVTLLTEAQRGTFLSVIGFSPQGDRILYSKEGDLWSIGVDGSNARFLVAGTTEGEWSPS